MSKACLGRGSNVKVMIKEKWKGLLVDKEQTRGVVIENQNQQEVIDWVNIVLGIYIDRDTNEYASPSRIKELRIDNPIRDISI